MPRRRDYTRFTKGILAKFRFSGRKFADLSTKNPESFRRWAHEPNRIRMEDLAILLKGAGFTNREQDDFVLDLYHECQKGL